MINTEGDTPIEAEEHPEDGKKMNTGAGEHCNAARENLAKEFKLALKQGNKSLAGRLFKDIQRIKIGADALYRDSNIDMNEVK